MEDVFCRDKTFVATKMILMAAPTNDTGVFVDVLTMLRLGY